MDAELEVRNAQQDWARARGIPFNSRGYVRDVADNPPYGNLFRLAHGKALKEGLARN